MEIGITGALCKFLKWSKLPAPQEQNLLACWDVSRVDANGLKLLLVMNVADRFVAVRRMKGADWKKLDTIVPEAIAQAMVVGGIPDQEIRDYLELAGDLRFTKTHGPSATGALSSIADFLWAAARSRLDTSTMFQPQITFDANGLPGHCIAHKGWTFPRDTFPQDLRALLGGDGPQEAAGPSGAADAQEATRPAEPAAPSDTPRPTELAASLESPRPTEAPASQNAAKRPESSKPQQAARQQRAKASPEKDQKLAEVIPFRRPRRGGM